MLGMHHNFSQFRLPRAEEISERVFKLVRRVPTREEREAVFFNCCHQTGIAFLNGNDKIWLRLIVCWYNKLMFFLVPPFLFSVPSGTIEEDWKYQFLTCLTALFF